MRKIESLVLLISMGLLLFSACNSNDLPNETMQGYNENSISLGVDITDKEQEEKDLSNPEDIIVDIDIEKTKRVDEGVAEDIFYTSIEIFGNTALHNSPLYGLILEVSESKYESRDQIRELAEILKSKVSDCVVTVIVVKDSEFNTQSDSTLTLYIRENNFIDCADITITYGESTVEFA